MTEHHELESIPKDLEACRALLHQLIDAIPHVDLLWGLATIAQESVTRHGWPVPGQDPERARRPGRPQVTPEGVPPLPPAEDPIRRRGRVLQQRAEERERMKAKEKEEILERLDERSAQQSPSPPQRKLTEAQLKQLSERKGEHHD